MLSAMSSDEGWGYQGFRRLLKFFTREEVKTPLSFLFKVVGYLVVALFFIIYSPLPDPLKETFFIWTIRTLLFLATAVLLLAWFRPRHLVYGESGFRAERKMEYGTEQHIIGKEDVIVLDQSSDPSKPLIEMK